MSKYPTREHLISFVSPQGALFPTEYALVFGTRHGVPKFADDIQLLYRQGYFEKLIISGGVTGQHAPSEARVMVEALTKRGLAEHMFILEENARNTGENVSFAREKAKHLGITELILIGKITSKRRYMMTVRKRWPDVRKICCHGVNYFSCSQAEWWKDQEFRRRVVSECRKIPTYIQKGFIADISIRDGVVID